MKLAATTLAFLIAGIASATPIPALADYSSSRSVGSGILGTWNWSGSGNNGFRISWQVTNSGTGSTPWTYSYTLSGSAVPQSLSKDLSHLIVQLSDITTAMYSFPSGTDAAAPREYDPTSNGSSNFGMPGDLFGVKWNCASNCSNPTFTFSTSQAPMWGSFYAISGKKPGKEVYAYNTGFGTAPADGTIDFSTWIVTPDSRTIDASTVGAVPEPGTWVLMAAGVGALGVARRLTRSA